MCTLQTACCAPQLGKAWAGDAIAALVRAGLGAFWLAHAEATAQAALSVTQPGAERPDREQPRMLRRSAGHLLAGVTGGVSPSVAHTLAKQGLVAPLLQVSLEDASQCICCAPRHLCCL